MDIKSRIKERGFTISQVAALMTTRDKDGNVKQGISQSALSQLITGNPTFDKLQEIANIIGISVSELVTDNSDDFTALVRNGSDVRAFDTVESLKKYINELCIKHDKLIIL
ncbi:MAG: helix-turn-helix transcriptional regulator [Barnesiella sp.]|nr:helix-turn-helix transcriptional regulator [Barnesiella sp.]